MWHLTACKISVNPSFLKWNDFYCISELMKIVNKLRLFDNPHIKHKTFFYKNLSFKVPA